MIYINLYLYSFSICAVKGAEKRAKGTKQVVCIFDDENAEICCLEVGVSAVLTRRKKEKHSCY